MDSATDFDFFEDRYPKRIRKPINKPDLIDELEDEVFFQKQKLMSHCVYDIQEIVESAEFKDDMVLKMPSAEGFNLDYIKQHGLSTPILFDVPAQELGMTMPDANAFTVFDVLELVGKERKIEVVEVNEQKGRTMKLVDFVKYYTCSPEFRRELLNVLSLEFSMTNLAKQVKPPSFVADIDWIDNVWPRELFERQKVHMKTNHLSDFSTYPKVQRYCLMSVANCFTDFHIDFGGTSVWYHVLKGKKIFWLIEPTEENLLLYEEWIMGGNNSESFFGRIVNKCNRVELTPGMTFIIPSGWIHCVFTPEDSLVFGGNFLHSYSISMQIRVVRSEDKIRVGSKYRFPHFKQMIWYTIEHIVRKATGRFYLRPIRPKAYLADLQHFDMQVPLTDGGEDDEATDDQEPCCSSAVEAGCKKAGIVKEAKTGTTFTNMGMEESDSDDESDTGRHVDDPNVCYDDIPNGGDCNLLVPTQAKYSAKNSEKFTPVSSYNEEYLASIPPTEKSGYFTLLEYAKKLMKTKRPEVGEGITRPKHLLLEFESLLNHIGETGALEVSADCHVKQPADRIVHREMKTQLVVPLPVVETVTAAFKEPSKKRNKRKLVKSEDAKTTPKTGKLSKRASDANSVLVDGLPLPLQSDEPPPPNPYGYNPLEAIVALGQKPLPSAYRKGANMAKLPPVQRFRLKKKDELNDSTTSMKSEESLNSSQQSMDSAFTPSPICKKEDNPMPIVKIHRLSSSSTATTTVGVAELTYKSPLQRLQLDGKHRKVEEERQRRVHDDRQRQFYEERQRRIEEERRRRVAEEEERQRAVEAERQRQASIEEALPQQSSSEVSSFNNFGFGAGSGFGSSSQIPAPSSLSGSGFGSGGGFGSGFGSIKNGELGYALGGGFSSFNTQFNAQVQAPRRVDGRPPGGFANNSVGRGGNFGGGEQKRRGRGGGLHFSGYSRSSFGGGRINNHVDSRGSGFRGRGHFNGEPRGDYRGGSHHNNNYYNNGSGYNNNNNNYYKKDNGGSDRWNNNGNHFFGNNGGALNAVKRSGCGFYKDQNQNSNVGAHPPPPFLPFPPIMPGLAFPSNEMLAQLGMPPIPDAYRQFGMPLGMPSMSTPPPSVPPPMAAGPYIQTPQNSLIAEARKYAASRNGISAAPSFDSNTPSANVRYSVSTDQEAMDEDSSPVVAPPPTTSYNSRAIGPRIADPRANSNKYANVVHLQAHQQRSATTAAEPYVSESMVDGFEGIDEIGRLTQMMSGGEDEDVDLRNSTSYSKSDSYYQPPSSASVSADSMNDRIEMSSGDPNADIDKLFRLTQMYTS